MNFLFLALAVQLASSVAGVEYVQPQLAADSKILALTFGSKDTVYFAKSTDHGRSFSDPVRVSDEGRLALGSRRGPRVAIVSGTIVVSAIVGEKGGGADGDLIAWRSTDGGDTWSTGTKVNDVPGSAREGLHGMVSDGKETLFTAWLDLRSKGTKLYGATSTDGGATWSENRLVYESPSGTICECCHPSVNVAPRGTIHVMFRNVIDEARDMYLISSTDAGASFGSASKLGSGTWKINGCPMDGGSIAVGDDGQLVSVWRREKQIYVSDAEEREKLLGNGTQPAVASVAGGQYIAWTNSDGIQVLPPRGTDPLSLDPNGRYVQVLSLSDGVVVAAWQSEGRLVLERLP